jgi:hypothetical protein
MREVANVTENQIVQLPPGLNIFKNSDVLRDVKLVADMQDEVEEVKMPVKEAVKMPKSFYVQIAEDLLAKEHDDLFGQEASPRGVSSETPPL